MLSRAALKQTKRVDAAVANRRAIRTAARLPFWLVHKLLVAGIRAETWLRYPLWALNTSDAFDETFRLLDPEGDRFGLTKGARSRAKRNFLYHEVADLVTLLMFLDSPDFGRRALRFENEEALRRAAEEGPGAIVAGFRLGAYTGVPWVVGKLGYPVLMIVGNDEFVRMGEQLGQTFIPESADAITFMRAKEPLVLAKAKATLNDGGLVTTLVDLSPVEYEKTTEVKLFDYEMSVPYGIPYLSAVTGRSIVPTILTRANGPRFTLRFGDPIAAPKRDSDSVRECTQELYDALARMICRFPDQWIGWPKLRAQVVGGADSDEESAVMPSLV